MVIRVQFAVNEEEYEELKVWAEEEGVSISKYVKDRIFRREETYKDVWNEFCEKLSDFPRGIEFDCSTIMTQERWRTFSRSTKLSLAKQLRKNVINRLEGFGDIILVGRSTANVTKYRKN